ncbi:MAG: hypothetical protein HY054_14595 [Proteobacteria bacterium]|nr:hypothetical protein [Pseudomonadota bacterium]
MRCALLAVTLAGLPALALAQTQTTPSPAHSSATPPADAQASGADTLAGEGLTTGPLASAPEAAASAATEPQANTPTPAVSAPAGVAAPGINLSANGASQQEAPPAHAAATTPPASVAAPGVNANRGAAHPTPARAATEPANELERAFINAARQASARVAFRHTFLESQVALATVSADANAAPREIRLGPGGEACLIFTSDARATQIMGPNAPRQLMTGRQALERIRGAPLVIININMDPYLTLDTAGIEAFLAADSAPPATHSAGPSQ